MLLIISLIINVVMITTPREEDTTEYNKDIMEAIKEFLQNSIAQAFSVRKI